MAQRRGAVICTVRIGNVLGPMIATGTADVILSTEPIEALRNIMYASKKTKVITDINPVIPFTVATGGEEYPNLDDVFQEIRSYAELFLIDASKIAKKSGDVITKNIVMLGALAATDVLPFKSEIGNLIINWVPKKRVSTVICPSISFSTICFAMYSPIPVPVAVPFVVK